MTRPLTIAASLAAVLVLASLPHSAQAQEATPTTEQAAPAEAEAVPAEASTAPAQPAAPAAATQAALAGNADNGRQLTYTCVGCHGIVGYRNVYPTYHVPKIGGPSAVYLPTARAESRRGSRTRPAVQAQAQAASDQGTAAVAAFQAELTPGVSRFSPAARAASPCLPCSRARWSP